MKVSPDLIRSEFLGNEAKIIKSTHQGNVGISGEITGETRNTFTLVCEGRRKIIVKDSCVFRISFPDKTIVEIDGRLLTGRSEDRLKRTVRRLW